MNKFLIIAILALGLGSCRKFLGERSQSELTPTTTEDYSELLFGTGYPLSTSYLQPQLVFMDDDIQCYNGQAIADQTSVTKNRAAYTWQPDFIEQSRVDGSPDVENYNSWKAYYKLILGCNIALQNADNSTGLPQEKNYLKGEAFTLRAYYYFMLVNLYGKPYNDSTTTPDQSPGVPLKLNANLTENYPTRNTVKEVYQQITKDLDSAHYFLDPAKKDPGVYRINHIAAHLLASRVYLYMEQWDSVVSNASYALQYHPQLMNLNDWGGVVDQENKPVLGAKNIETMFAFGNVAEYFPFGRSVSYEVSDNLGQLYTADDLRGSIYVTFTPVFLRFFITPDYFNVKNPPQSFGAGLYATFRGTGWRTSEAILNRAEANIQKYRKGDAAAGQAAVNDLNTLRKQRFSASGYQNWTLQSPDVMLQMCREERRRELTGEEGQRWFDLRRYGMPAITHSYMPDATTTQHCTLQAHDPQYTLPIPVDVLQRNPALVQNPELAGARPVN